MNSMKVNVHPGRWWIEQETPDILDVPWMHAHTLCHSLHMVDAPMFGLVNPGSQSGRENSGRFSKADPILNRSFRAHSERILLRYSCRPFFNCAVPDPVAGNALRSR